MAQGSKPTHVDPYHAPERAYREARSYVESLHASIRKHRTSTNGQALTIELAMDALPPRDNGLLR